MRREVLALLHDVEEAGSAILELSGVHTYDEYRTQRWLRSSIEREFITTAERCGRVEASCLSLANRCGRGEGGGRRAISHRDDHASIARGTVIVGDRERL